MDLVRRILCACLAIALTHFGVVATAPAHAHDSEVSHAVRTIMIDEYHHALHGHESIPLDQGHGTEDSTESDLAPHIHFCPQFAHLGNESQAIRAALIAETTWPEVDSGIHQSGFNPPLRPPRILL